jgi:hypothetical protein
MLLLLLLLVTLLLLALQLDRAHICVALLRQTLHLLHLLKLLELVLVRATAGNALELRKQLGLRRLVSVLELPVHTVLILMLVLILGLRLQLLDLLLTQRALQLCWALPLHLRLR